MNRFRFIDLFSGAGGFSLGAEAAGCKLVWACNHDPVAVEYHARHFPEARHTVEDLRLVDFSELRRSVGRIDLIVASPSCTGHTRARGGERPHHREARATAWCVVSALEELRPEYVVVENVPEFAQWSLFGAWCDALGQLGYQIDLTILDSADVGVPQSRVRLFVCARRGKAPRPIPVPREDRRSARSILSLDDEFFWNPIEAEARRAAGLRPLAQNTLVRIQRGREIHGAEFLVAYYGSEVGGRSLDVPLGTVTTRARHLIVRGGELRMVQPEELRRAMDFPEDFHLPSQKAAAIKLLGNAVPRRLAHYVVAHTIGSGWGR